MLRAESGLGMFAQIFSDLLLKINLPLAASSGFLGTPAVDSVC